MTPEQFHDILRSFSRQEPFVPYTVFLNNGDRIDIDHPHAVAFDGGAAGFIQAGGEVIFFDCEDVRQIVAATPEPKA